MQKDENSPPQFHVVTPDENNGDNNNMQTAKKHGKWTLIGSTSQTGTNHFTSDLESCAHDAHMAVSRTMNDTNVIIFRNGCKHSVFFFGKTENI
jgi:hypothetical protein